uniref:Uncharacterized protein n=1 Tax=Arundo donax TaxID=35708 RepID=A0A0A9ER48_ARUDO
MVVCTFLDDSKGSLPEKSYITTNIFLFKYYRCTSCLKNISKAAGRQIKRMPP